jgi:UDP-N-acetylglucosamine acyltransferase
VVIGEGAAIEDGTTVGAHAVIESATIGKNCRIFPHASVGLAPQDMKYNNEPTSIIIGDRCTVREFATLNRGTGPDGKTIIGNDCLFMAYSHVAHDCVLGNGIILANVATLGGHVEVGDYAVFGGITAVHQFTRIGRMAMIAGGAMVSQDVIPFGQVHDNRARLVGLNLVGMKRRGFSRETIEEIKQAYKTIFMSSIPMGEAMDQLNASGPSHEVKELVTFIANSKRGICRPCSKEDNEE